MSWWLSIAFDGVYAGGVAWVGLAYVLPELRIRAARGALLTLVAAAIAAPPVLAALSAVFDVRIAIALSGIPVLVAWLAPSWLVRVTGGPRPSRDDLTDVMSGVQQANYHFDVGDVETWRQELGKLDALRTPESERYIDLWQRYAAEETERRAGLRQSSQETLEAIRATAREMAGRAFALRPRLLATLVAVAVAVAVLPQAAVATLLPLASADACIQATALLSSTPAIGDQASNAQTLAGLLLTDPGTAANLADQGILDLDTLAASRHDPNSRQLLIDDQYISGYARTWETPDGRIIDVEVEQFASASGAAAFDRSMVLHACAYSNTAFEVPGGGVGLQIRYGTGDPIHEQISWVVGARRLLVSHTFLVVPATHSIILDLAARTRALATGSRG